MNSSATSDKKKPVLYLLYGDDGHEMANTVQEMAARLGEQSIAEMNITRFEGNPRIEDLRNAAFAMPFLAERRLVIVSKAIEFVRSQKNKEPFLAFIPQIPQTSALVLLVETEFDRKKWKDFDKNHWLLNWVNSQQSDLVWTKEIARPDARKMVAWIKDEVARQKGEINTAAAMELAGFLGTNTQLASLEIDKLLNYVNFERPVEVDDVIELISDIAPISVFDMVDAMAEGRKRDAVQLLHGLLENEEIYLLFGMIVRQFRLLLLAREVLDQGGSQDRIARDLHVHPFVAGKLFKQAQHFTQNDLDNIYKKLLAIDENMKTSQMDALIALDIFVSELVAA